MTFVSSCGWAGFASTVYCTRITQRNNNGGFLVKRVAVNKRVCVRVCVCVCVCGVCGFSLLMYAVTYVLVYAYTCVCVHL